MDKRYQVFVSSTYDDLVEERKEVSQAILECNCIPAGMELFPASSKKQWDVIKKVIDDCDYYLVIIAGKYGSLGKNDDGNEISYTEMEFDYALKTGKPIIAFLHRDPGIIVAKKTERTNIESLDKFRSKAKDGRMISYWDNADNLRAAVLKCLPQLIKDTPTNGWIPCNSAYDLLSNSMKTLQNLGVVDILYKNLVPIAPEEFYQMAKEICILFTSGPVFFRENRERLKMALKNGAVIKVIIASPKSDYVKEVEEMQTSSEDVRHNNQIDYELEQAEEYLKGLNSCQTTGTILFSSFNTQFRGNIFIIDDKLAYYSPVLPPKTSRETMTLKLQGGSLMKDCKLHFNTLFSVLNNKGMVKRI